MSTTAEGSRDYLAGVTEKTKKNELMELLEQANAELRKINKERVGRLRAIVKRVQDSYRDRDWRQDDYKQVIVQGTNEEFADSVEFMGDLEEVLPPVLQRLLVGMRTFVEETK